jgi:DNA-directed RNA polymerase specialized sigma24 family protein
MIDNESNEPPYDKQEQIAASASDAAVGYDLERLFEAMPTKRYVKVIRRLILEDCEPEELAREMKITTANLYNIKRRAMAQLTRIALNDIKEYGK